MLLRARARLEVSYRPAGAIPLVLAGLLAASLTLGAPSAARAALVAPEVAYLRHAQNPDGGFGAAPGQASSELYTAWAAMGLAAAGVPPATVTHDGHSVLDALRSGVSQLSGLGDDERTILALRASGAAVSAFPGRNLVASLLAGRSSNGSFNDQVNTTAFAIFALRASGTPARAGVIVRTGRWLAAQQNPDGGFSFAARGAASDIDDTAAALQGIAASRGRGDRAVARAVSYLRRQQSPDGGWPLQPGAGSDAQSTAWAIQALDAAGVDLGTVRRATAAGCWVRRAVDRLGDPGARRGRRRSRHRPARGRTFAARLPEHARRPGRQRALLAHERADAGVGDRAGLDRAGRRSLPGATGARGGQRRDLTEECAGTGGRPAHRPGGRTAARLRVLEGPSALESASGGVDTICMGALGDTASLVDMDDTRQVAPDVVSRRLHAALWCAALSIVGLAATWFIAGHVPQVRLSDAAALRGFIGLDHPTVSKLSTVTLALVSLPTCLAFALAAMAVAVHRRRFRLAVAVPIVLAGAILSAEWLKPALAVSHAFVTSNHQISDASWPSGHSTAAMTMALCALLVASPRWRPAVAAIGGLFALAVGFSLLTLAWHMPSDVIGGYLLAALWASAAVALLCLLDARRPGRVAARRPAGPQRAETLVPGVVLGSAFGLALAVALLRPHQVADFAAAHHSLVAVAAVITGLAASLVSGFTLALRR
jgi:membrane-associated phospholipid phosphatase